jgi:hypothetical protein
MEPTSGSISSSKIPNLIAHFLGFRFQVSAQPLAAETASLIEKETLGDEILMVSRKVRIRHAGLDKPAPHSDAGASRTYRKRWIPAFAGMTL